MADGKLVYIKQVETNDEESRIALLLDSYGDVDNHAVPILDTFVDARDETISYLVMPFLRLLDDPPFESIGEILDFADQVLEVSDGSLVSMDATRVNRFTLRASHSCTPKGSHTGDFLIPYTIGKSLTLAI